MRSALLKGKVEVLSWLRAHTHTTGHFEYNAYCDAIQGGHITALDWLIEHVSILTYPCTYHGALISEGNITHDNGPRRHFSFVLLIMATSTCSSG